MVQAAATLATALAESLSIEPTDAPAFGRRLDHGHLLRMAGILIGLEEGKKRGERDGQQDIEGWVLLCRSAATPSLSAAVAGQRRGTLAKASTQEVLLVLADCLDHVCQLNDRLSRLGTHAFIALDPQTLAEDLEDLRAALAPRIAHDSPSRPLLERLTREARDLRQAADYARRYPARAL